MEDNTSSEKKIKQYFTSDAWTALSEYEKRRYENVQRNYEFLKASGITPKMPEFMMTKYNPSNPKSCMKMDCNIPKEQNYRLTISGDGIKKAKFKLFAVPKKPSTKTKSVDKGLNIDIAFSLANEFCTAKKETTAMINLRNVSPKEFAQTLMLSAQNALKIFEEIIGNKEVLMLDPIYEDGAAPKRRYPKRSIERKCYVEEDISSEDESLRE
ncbi:histone-lysine N-methyltransferase PRDM9 [Trichonephila inaurata madagascariensis]|uniref:Histone-lysine N-methyltransferase PRDM9 n=1 Tax=Trichonephila inaurata madagascariensis TaxID=2747483 RepID=A0A8X7CT67_9ARAC|nr:histone-lysine N-methyltransferase PRDM9 [Trichonephila inaurata madagascariensis]